MAQDIRIEGDHYVLPHGVKIKTPEALGIDPSDPNYDEEMRQYADFFKSITGVLYDADKFNKAAIEADVAAATVGVGNALSGGGDAAGDGSGDTSSGGGSGSSFLGGVGDFIKKYGETALDAIGAYETAQRLAQADKYAQQGVDFAKQTYADNAPLRTAGRAGMLNPTANAPDLSGLRSISSVNPFSRGPIPLPASARPAAPAPSSPAAPIPIPAPAAPHPAPVGTSPSHAVPLSLTAAPPAPLAAPVPGAPNTLTAAPARPIPLTGIKPLTPTVPKAKPIPLSMGAL